MFDPLKDYHIKSNQKPIRVKNVLPPTMDEAMLPTKIKNILALHGVTDPDRLLHMRAHDFLSLWGLGWAAWQDVVAYKRYRERKDGKRYL